MQNKLDFGGIGFNVMLAKASLKCTIFVRSNWNTVKFVLVYCIISYIFCVIDYTVSLNMLKWSSTDQRTYKHLFVVQVYMHYSFKEKTTVLVTCLNTCIVILTTSGTSYVQVLKHFLHVHVYLVLQNCLCVHIYRFLLKFHS